MEYKVIRTRRKTIAISVSPENEVVVRCPLNFPQYKIEQFIYEKQNWLSGVLKENEQKLSANKGVTEYSQIYVQGSKVPLIFGDKNCVTPSAVYVKSIGDIKKLFIKSLSREFLNRAEGLAANLNFFVKTFSVRHYKSRWGCCDRQGNIKFNYLLLMLPFDLQRYVIIHELCHTVHFNHSKQFWGLVANFEPNYRKLRSKLKSFDFIIKLY